MSKFFTGILFALICWANTYSVALAQSASVVYSPDGQYSQVKSLGDVAWWKFDSDNPGADKSGKGLLMQSRGQDSRFEEGKLVIEEKLEPGDKRAGAAVVSVPTLTPVGAFSLEVWFQLGEDFAQKPLLFLLDKKYYHYPSDAPDANTDYLLLLRKSGTGFVLEAQLGFGSSSSVLRSQPQALEAGKAYHALFNYDAMSGGQFFLNGNRIGEYELQNKGGVMAGKNDLVIGDRVGSAGARLLGKISQVRISSIAIRFAGENERVFLSLENNRTAFARFEKNAQWRLKVTNNTGKVLRDAVAHMTVENAPSQRYLVPLLEAGQSAIIDIPLNTELRPQQYRGRIGIEDSARESFGPFVEASFTIVPRSVPYQMPVVLWGATVENSNGAIKDLKEMGFTHQLTYPSIESQVWKQSALDKEAESRKLYDTLFANGLGAIADVAPGHHAVLADKQYQRLDPTGKPYARANVDGNFPRVQEFARDTGKAIANAFIGDPGLQSVLINSEVRDGTQISFTPASRQAYREATGREIPGDVTSPHGVNYKNLTGFPANRVVPENDELLNFYRWFWSEGDGWPRLNTQVVDGLKSVAKDRFWTFNDPAVRVPSIWGSGGSVDYLSQWTYTYPDPLKIALAGDELFAMAKGRDGQGVMNMTQAIWYRTQTTGEPKENEAQDWEKPEAKFITVAPDHVSEALWLKLTRGVRGIMYHGWGSLSGAPHNSYKLTNPQTRVRLTDLLHNVVKPLGPALLQIPDRTADVAFLESFSSQMFAGRGTYGWGSGWGADSYLIANYAGLQPDIVYEQTITRDGLAGYKILFLTHCDVLPRNVVQRIEEFQRKGGLVVGDEFLTPAIQPDILLTSIRREVPDVAKNNLLQRAATLRQELEKYYVYGVKSNNPEVIVRNRTYKNAQYLFTVNDRRGYGDYVGQYKKVMEKGLPARSEITLNNRSGFIYDLVNSREVKTNRVNGDLHFTVELDGGAGNLFLVMDRAAGELQVSVPAAVKRGQSLPVTIQMKDSGGQALQAVVPLEVAILDSDGNPAEQSGYYGAVDGRLNLNLDIASNDKVGRWRIVVKERLRNQQAVADFVVQ